MYFFRFFPLKKTSADPATDWAQEKKLTKEKKGKLKHRKPVKYAFSENCTDCENRGKIQAPEAKTALFRPHTPCETG